MQQKEIKFLFQQFESVKELSRDDRKLLEEAIAASAAAYARYSKFKVGAAILLENGVIVKGSNQENAAYPSGLCAERVAAFAAASGYPGIKFRSIAVAAFLNENKEPHPAGPCGNCRQVLAEYELLYGSPIRVIMIGEERKIIIADNTASLLPFLFKG